MVGNFTFLVVIVCGVIIVAGLRRILSASLKNRGVRLRFISYSLIATGAVIMLPAWSYETIGLGFILGLVGCLLMPPKRVPSTRKEKIVILGMCIGFVVLLALYLGLFAGGPETTSPDNQGRPPFETKMVYSLPLGENEIVSARKVIVSDLTGDGRKEILVSYDVASCVEQEVEGETTFMLLFKEARMSILSSDTADNFQKSWGYDSGLLRQTVAVGDFDGDGKPDIVVGGFMIENVGDSPQSVTSRVEVLLQREDGSFGKVFSSNIPQFFGPGFIAAGDFDEDGRTDFVVSGLAAENESPYHTYLFHNEGGENFTMSPIALRERVIVEDMWKADINNDGSSDLIIRALDRDNETYSMILLLNNGRGEFDFRELDISPNVVTIEDFTGNEYPDIIYTEENIQSGDEVYLLRNDQGKFAESKSINMENERRFVGIISADFNNDNTPDVLLLEIDVEFKIDLERFETSLIWHLLLIEENAGEFSSTREWSYEFLEGENISSRHAMAATDINNNGLIDLILVSEDGGIYLALNQHD